MSVKKCGISKMITPPTQQALAGGIVRQRGDSVSKHCVMSYRQAADSSQRREGSGQISGTK